MRYQLEGIDELVRDGLSASSELDHNLDECARDAAEKGLVAFTQQHPYTDRTFNLTASARVERPTYATAGHHVRDMVWGGEDSDAPYAEFVERMPNYKFTTAAAEEAQRVLDVDVVHAVGIFEDKLSGR